MYMFCFMFTNPIVYLHLTSLYVIEMAHSASAPPVCSTTHKALAVVPSQKEGGGPTGWHVLRFMEISARYIGTETVETSLNADMHINTISLKGWIESKKNASFFLRIPINIRGMSGAAEVTSPVAPLYTMDSSSILKFGLSREQLTNVESLLFTEVVSFRRIKNWVEFLADIRPVMKDIESTIHGFFHGQPSQLLSVRQGGQPIHIVITQDVVYRVLAYFRDRSIALILNESSTKEIARGTSPSISVPRFKSTSLRVPVACSSLAKKKEIKRTPPLTPQEIFEYAFPKKVVCTASLQNTDSIAKSSTPTTDAIKVEDGEVIMKVSLSV